MLACKLDVITSAERPMISLIRRAGSHASEACMRASSAENDWVRSPWHQQIGSRTAANRPLACKAALMAARYGSIAAVACTTA